jgi:hypothetical protein
MLIGRYKIYKDHITLKDCKSLDQVNGCLDEIHDGVNLEL